MFKPIKENIITLLHSLVGQEVSVETVASNHRGILRSVIGDDSNGAIILKNDTLPTVIPIKSIASFDTNSIDYGRFTIDGSVSGFCNEDHCPEYVEGNIHFIFPKNPDTS